MTEVEQADVTQINRLFVKHGSRDHAQCDEIPEGPRIVPFLSSGYTKG